jgi:hypothetical protein
MENMQIYNALKTPDPTALKLISGGRLNGKTDISPQWRYEAMTQQFGPCGIGWQFRVCRVWAEDCADGQRMAHAEVELRINVGGEWSEPIPGYGGSMLIEQERNGLHVSDEGYKKAITDALGTAMKMIGVAADVYRGSGSGSKYQRPAAPVAAQQTAVQPPPSRQAMPPQPATSGMQSVGGPVEQVATKPTSKGGTRYGVKVGGAWYNTFDAHIGEEAQRCRDAGLPVTIEYHTTQYGNDIDMLAGPYNDGLPF